MSKQISITQTTFILPTYRHVNACMPCLRSYAALHLHLIVLWWMYLHLHLFFIHPRLRVLSSTCVCKRTMKTHNDLAQRQYGNDITCERGWITADVDTDNYVVKVSQWSKNTTGITITLMFTHPKHSRIGGLPSFGQVGWMQFKKILRSQKCVSNFNVCDSLKQWCNGVV